VLGYKYPVEYELTPKEIDHGIHWLTLKLKNIGSKTITDLDVRLHSLDTFYLSVYGTGYYIPELKPDKERELVFRVDAFGSASVYATISAHKEGDYFWWESGWIYIQVSEEKAELERILVLSHPYTTIGKTIKAEATLKGLLKSSGLKLEFWADTPSGKWEELANIETKDLSVGEEAQYSAEFTPKETGYYTINAYLYDGWKRIGHKTHSIYARKS
jgi:hypothetical protein